MPLYSSLKARRLYNIHDSASEPGGRQTEEDGED